MTTRTTRQIYASLVSFFATLLMATALSGCGPNLVSDEASANEMGSSAYSFGQSEDSNYKCPSYENITSPDDRVMDGTHRYVACANRTSTTKVKLIGYSSTSPVSCVFPVQFINDTQFIYKLDRYNLPMYSCYSGATNAGSAVELDYPATNYNGVVVVDQNLRAQMTTCLTTGQNCPMHAIGRFR